MLASIAYSFAELPDMVRALATIAASSLAFAGAGRAASWLFALAHEHDAHEHDASKRDAFKRDAR